MSRSPRRRRPTRAGTGRGERSAAVRLDAGAVAPDVLDEARRIAAGIPPFEPGDRVLRSPIDYSIDDLVTRMRTVSPLTPPTPASRRAPRLRPVSARAAVRLLDVLARTRADTRLLADDVPRLTRSATTGQRDLRVVRRTARRLASSLYRLGRRAGNDPDIIAVADRARVLDRLLRALENREPWYVRVRDLGLTATRDRIRIVLTHLTTAVAGIEIELRATDLSRFTGRVGDLVGAVWDSETVWPAELVGQVRAASRPVDRDTFIVVDRSALP